MKAIVRGTLAILCSVGVHPAQAELRGGIGTEYFSWVEDTSPEVRETGGLLAFALEFNQPRDAGLLFGYRGRLYAGAVTYEGSELFPPRRPVTGTTEYAGTSQEVQARYRFLVGDLAPLDVVAGAGVDLWQRKLSSIQKEDFVIGYARVGLELEPDRRGWIAGGGLKIPFYTWEDAHLDDIGFSSNPVLKPGKAVSPYAHLGYRFDGPFAFLVYLDTFRFTRSPAERVTHATQGVVDVLQPASTRVNVGFRVVFHFD